MIKCSIITINLNNSAGLAKTIESVLSQTYYNFEYIIVDGKSSDNSVDIIKVIKSDKLNWLSEVDKGIYSAMNKGIRMAKGDFLIFLNSGDTFADSKVMEDVFCKNTLDADVIYGDTYYLNYDGSLFHKKSPATLSFNYLIEDDINHQSCFIKKSLFNKYGLYDETLKIASDHKFFIQSILLGTASYIYVNRVIAVYNLEGISSLNQELQYSERAQIHKEQIPKIVWEFYLSNSKYKLKKDKSFLKRFKTRIYRYLNK